MRYIENSELREWIKEKLSKAIFQKAHALAIQTGCEILVKLDDKEDTTGSQYYATNTLEHVFNSNGLRKKPGDLPVSGDTGLPLNPTVDIVIQSTEDKSASKASSGGSTSSVEDIAQRLSNKVLGSGDFTANAVPMQLSLAEDTMPKSNSENEQSPVQSTPTDPGPTDETELDITVKIEPVGDEHPPDPGDPNVNNLADNNNTGMSFSMDTSNNQSLLGPSQPPHTVHDFNFGGMSRDTKLYPVPISPKPYQCAVCHKAFRSVQVLQKHTQTFHMRVGVMPRRGRGRGRPSGFARSHTFTQFGNQAPVPQSRFLCVICSRVFSEAHLLKEHIEHSHFGQEIPQSSQGSFEETISMPPSQLAGDMSFPLDEPPGNSPNLEDIPGPSTSDPGSAIPMSQIPSGSMVPFGQPQTSASAPFTHPPPKAFGGFATPSAPPRTSMSNLGSAHHGGVSMRGNKTTSSHRRHSQQLLTVRSIMSGILLTAGPISTHSAFTRLGPNQLRCATKEQYMQAAKALQNANLGRLLTLQNISRLSSVFLKRPPVEVKPILTMNPDLCTVTVYAARFSLPVPACINKKVPEKLVEMGYLSETRSYFGT